MKKVIIVSIFAILVIVLVVVVSPKPKHIVTQEEFQRVLNTPVEPFYPTPDGKPTVEMRK